MSRLFIERQSKLPIWFIILSTPFIACLLFIVMKNKSWNTTNMTLNANQTINLPISVGELCQYSIDPLVNLTLTMIRVVYSDEVCVCNKAKLMEHIPFVHKIVFNNGAFSEYIT